MGDLTNKCNLLKCIWKVKYTKINIDRYLDGFKTDFLVKISFLIPLKSQKVKSDIIWNKF